MFFKSVHRPDSAFSSAISAPSDFRKVLNSRVCKAIDDKEKMKMSQDESIHSSCLMHFQKGEKQHSTVHVK